MSSSSRRCDACRPIRKNHRLIRIQTSSEESSSRDMLNAYYVEEVGEQDHVVPEEQRREPVRHLQAGIQHLVIPGSGLPAWLCGRGWWNSGLPGYSLTRTVVHSP